MTKQSSDPSSLASGHQPAAVVWSAESGRALAVLRGHRYGVESVAFCPSDDAKVLTLGADNDGHVALWDWREERAWRGTFARDDVRPPSRGIVRRDRHRVRDGGGATPQGVDRGHQGRRAHDGSKFHAKYRKLAGAARTTSESSGWSSAGPRMRTWGVTRRTRGSPCARRARRARTGSAVRPTPATTRRTIRRFPTTTRCMPSPRKGVLCMLRRGERVERWVDARVRRGGSVAVGGPNVAVAAGDGVVRIFQRGTLAYRGTLPRPDRAELDASPGSTRHPAAPATSFEPPPGVAFPDAVACAFDTRGVVLTVAYSDRSVFRWDVRSSIDGAAHPVRRFFAHSAAVWGVAPLPPAASERGIAPRGTFATCAADGSVRLWHLGERDDRTGGGDWEHPEPHPVGSDQGSGTYSQTAVMYATPDPSREAAALKQVEKQADGGADEAAVAAAGGHALPMRRDEARRR